MYDFEIYFILLNPINRSFKISKSDSKNERLPKNVKVLRVFLFCVINMGVIFIIGNVNARIGEEVYLDVSTTINTSITK